MVLPEEQVARRHASDRPVRLRGLLVEGGRIRTDPVDALLVESMDEALTELLGRRAREAIYDHLERNYLAARNEIPDRLPDLFIVLDETFGRGSRTIGRVIAKKLYTKLGWEFADIPSYELEDYLKVARERLGRQLANHRNYP
jgi:hypothetical protein